MSKSEYSPLGKRIQEIQSGCGDTEFAKNLGISRNQLHNIKYGKTGTSHATLARLAELGKLNQVETEALFMLAALAHPQVKSNVERLRQDLQDLPIAEQLSRVMARIQYHSRELQELIALMQELEHQENEANRLKRDI